MTTTQIIEASSGVITEEMYAIARTEGKDVEFIRERVADGRIVILKNNTRIDSTPIAIGEGLRVKINSSVGTNSKTSTIESELDKLRVIEQAGADAVMDLSKGSFIDETREAVISATKLPVGTVPIYESAKEILDEYRDISKLSKDKLFSDIEKQCNDGVDFITIHCGVTKFVVDQLEKQKRFGTLTSKGGAILASYIKTTGLENPLYEYFDELLDLVRSFDVTLLFGNGMRAGCTFDASDRAQMAEFIIFGELIKKSRHTGVQAMVEGPEHIALNKIPPTIKLIKELTDGAPLYTHGPMVCDCADGYNHITGAIGGTLAAYHGVDFLYCVTPFEELGQLNSAQIKEGIITAKISAHCADLAKENKKTIEQNKAISIAKANCDIKSRINCSIDKTSFDGINLLKDGNNDTTFDKYLSLDAFKKNDI